LPDSFFPLLAAALKQYIPTDEEIGAINEIDDKEALNIADKYFLEVFFNIFLHPLIQLTR